MSACNTCPVPGHCCRSIVLGGGAFARDAQTPDQALWEVERHNAKHLPPDTGPIPFQPLFKRATDGAWVWWCPNLNQQTGRCDDYANRPYCCHRYEPGQDALCVLHDSAS